MTDKKMKQLLTLLYEYKSDNLTTLKQLEGNGAEALKTMIKSHNSVVDSVITMIKYNLE